MAQKANRNKTNQNYKKGFMAQIILVAIVLVSYGGYRLIEYNSYNYHDHMGIHYKTPKDYPDEVATTSSKSGSYSNQIYKHSITTPNGVVDINILSEDLNSDLSFSEFKAMANDVNENFTTMGVQWPPSTFSCKETSEAYIQANTGIQPKTETWVSYYIYYDKEIHRVVTVMAFSPMNSSEEAAQIMATLTYER